MNNFISVQDVADVKALVAKALAFKSNPSQSQYLGQNKKIGLLFFNPSLRTRISTQLAAKNLGLDPIVFEIGKDGWALEFNEGAVMNGSTVEHIKDAAPVLGQYFDILCIRTFPKFEHREDDYQEMVLNAFIEHAKIPVVSLESATLHPLQSLADIITMTEHEAQYAGRKPKVVLTWAPHIKSIPQCVSNSFAQWVNAWGEADFVIAQPEGWELEEQFTKGATITHDQEEALKDADFVYVKNWSSYKDYGKVYPNGEDWMLTEAKLAAAPLAKVMHCLPVRRNVELSDEILDGERSLIQQQAGNRVWSAQSVLASILENDK